VIVGACPSTRAILTPEQVRGLRLMDNRSHEEAGWDFDLLGPELIDLQRLGYRLYQSL